MEELTAQAHRYEDASLADVAAWALELRGEKPPEMLSEALPPLVAQAALQVLAAAQLALGELPAREFSQLQLALLKKRKASEVLTRGMFVLLVVHRARAAAAVHADVGEAFAGRK